jgi:predicted RND superfamily exporter protein
VYLSVGVIVTIAVSIYASLCLSLLLGFDFTLLHTMVPFLLLGVGVDDAYVILQVYMDAMAINQYSRVLILIWQQTHNE